MSNFKKVFRSFYLEIFIWFLTLIFLFNSYSIRSRKIFSLILFVSYLSLIMSFLVGFMILVKNIKIKQAIWFCSGILSVVFLAFVFTNWIQKCLKSDDGTEYIPLVGEEIDELEIHEKNHQIKSRSWSSRLASVRDSDSLRFSGAFWRSRAINYPNLCPDEPIYVQIV